MSFSITFVILHLYQENNLNFDYIYYIKLQHWETELRNIKRITVKIILEKAIYSPY